MTQEEFDALAKEVLSPLPPEFQQWVSYHAWEEHHAYGFDEVISSMREMVADLQEPIEKYTKRIAKH